MRCSSPGEDGTRALEPRTKVRPLATVILPSRRWLRNRRDYCTTGFTIGIAWNGRALQRLFHACNSRIIVRNAGELKSASRMSPAHGRPFIGAEGERRLLWPRFEVRRARARRRLDCGSTGIRPEYDRNTTGMGPAAAPRAKEVFLACNHDARGPESRAECSDRSVPRLAAAHRRCFSVRWQRATRAARGVVT